MKTHKDKLVTRKAKGNAFDNALIRLGHHFLPQQPVAVPVPVRKK